MKTKPILFSPPMVAAIINGSKFIILLLIAEVICILWTLNAVL